MEVDAVGAPRPRASLTPPGTGRTAEGRVTGASSVTRPAVDRQWSWSPCSWPRTAPLGNSVLWTLT